jgi:hypothetical protein
MDEVRNCADLVGYGNNDDTIRMWGTGVLCGVRD